MPSFHGDHYHFMAVQIV